MKKSFLGLSVFTAIAASLCCITPVLAILAGSTGLASSFSWLSPARPYLIGLTVAILAISWYQHLKRKASLRRLSAAAADESGENGLTASLGAATVVDCACEEPNRSSFMQSTTFLILVTLFAALSIAFPYYGGYLLGSSRSHVAQEPSSQMIAMGAVADMSKPTKAILSIPSMDCEACARGIQHVVTQLPGVKDARVSFPDKKAWISFDPQVVRLEQIDSAINATGFPVQKQEIVSH
ncbi:MAG: cation transporter [Thermoflavifilum sp.]|nr:cation transporter [Thermoflavifilum sp.]